MSSSEGSSRTGSNPSLLCLLHWQVDSSLALPGKPIPHLICKLLPLNKFFRIYLESSHFLDPHTSVIFQPTGLSLLGPCHVFLTSLAMTFLGFLYVQKPERVLKKIRIISFFCSILFMVSHNIIIQQFHC